ncbi:MAG: hypothetical protein SGI74_13865 [Oligoflexia bacterium]|nr:hypothetical protein [Oligoflexia bacterium]
MFKFTLILSSLFLVVLFQNCGGGTQFHDKSYDGEKAYLGLNSNALTLNSSGAPLEDREPRSNDTPPTEPILPRFLVGSWGLDAVGAVASSDGLIVNLKCDSARVDGAVFIDSNGKFSAHGTYTNQPDYDNNSSSGIIQNTPYIQKAFFNGQISNDEKQLYLRIMLVDKRVVFEAKLVAGDHRGDYYCGPQLPKKVPLLSGHWASEDIDLIVEKAGDVNINLNCASAHIDGPIAVKSDGSFSGRGTYFQAMGLEIIGGNTPIKAEFNGRISKQYQTSAGSKDATSIGHHSPGERHIMILKITESGTHRLLGNFTLYRDGQATLAQCLLQ